MIWSGDKMPLTAYKNILYTMSLHPTWKIELWTEKRLLSEMKLLKKQYLKTRDFRQKADLARYEILSRHGGIYVDADFQFYRSLDVLKWDLLSNICKKIKRLFIQIIIQNQLI